MNTAIEKLALQQGLPASIRAEREFLGGCLLARCIPPEAAEVDLEDFTAESRRRVFLACLALKDLGQPLDPVGVAEIKHGHLESAGGIAGVSELTVGMPVLPSLLSYVRILKEKSALRRLLLVAKQIATEVTQAEPPNEIIDRALVQLEGARPANLKDIERYTLNDLDKQYQHFADHVDEHRIRLGISKVDELTGGVAFGEVITIIARTSVGKSAIAQNLIANVLESYPAIGVIFFSLEMPRLQAFERQLQIAEQVPRETVLSAYRNDKSSIKAGEFVRRYNDRYMIVDDTRLGLEGIKRFVRGAVAAKLVKPVKFLVIDYLGLLDRPGSKASITERISVLAREVKQAAKELNCAVLLVAQTSRTAGDGSEEVTVVDARDSGAIEDSADFLLGCWRPELRKGISLSEYKECKGQLWISVLKNRRGPRDKLCVPFEGKTLSVGGSIDASVARLNVKAR